MSNLVYNSREVAKPKKKKKMKKRSKYNYKLFGGRAESLGYESSKALIF